MVLSRQARNFEAERCRSRSNSQPAQPPSEHYRRGNCRGSGFDNWAPARRTSSSAKPARTRSGCGHSRATLARAAGRCSGTGEFLLGKVGTVTWQGRKGGSLRRCGVVRAVGRIQWVLEEAGQGKRRRVLVPVLKDAVEPSMGFGLIQAADLAGWRRGEPSEEFAGFLEDIARILSSEAVAPARRRTSRELKKARMSRPVLSFGCPETQPLAPNYGDLL